MIGRLVVGVAVTMTLTGTALIRLSPISPVDWTPPAPHLPADACSAAPRAEARKLTTELPGKPDGLAFAPDGQLLAALTSGDVIAVDTRSGDWTIRASGGGFLTGLAAARDGTMYAVDEHAGALLAAQPGDRFGILLNSVGTTKLSWANDVTVTADGSVYVTTTATGRNLDDFFLEVLEHSPSGLLLRFDPATDEARIVADGLRMTNGVAVASNGDLLVAESAVYGVGLFDSNGRRGEAIEGLPGFTGNIRASDRPGVYWLTLLSPRSGLMDDLSGQPWARQLLAWLPVGLRPGPAALPCVIEVTQTGQELSVRAMHIGGVDTSFSTAIERDGRLYLSPASITPGSEPSLYVVEIPHV